MAERARAMVLRTMLRLASFLAASKLRDLENAIEDEDAEELGPSEHADEKLELALALSRVQGFVEITLGKTFTNRSFWWDGTNTLYTSSGDGCAFPVVRFEHWNAQTDNLQFWFRLRCDYGVVDDMLHSNRGHHSVMFKQAGDAIWVWDGSMSYRGRIYPYKATKMVEDEAQAFEFLEESLVGWYAQHVQHGDDSPDDDGDDVMDALHRLDPAGSR